MVVSFHSLYISKYFGVAIVNYILQWTLLYSGARYDSCSLLECIEKRGFS